MTPELLEPTLRKLERRVRFSAEDRAAFLALPAREQVLDTARPFIREGDPSRHCCALITGFAYRSRSTGGGARQILSFHLPGDVVDLQNALLGVADHDVQMLTRGRVAFISRDAMSELAFERPAIARALWLETLVDGSIFREWIVNVGRRNARTRLAHLLCEFAVRMNAAGLNRDRQYDMPLTQEQLGDATGLTPVHVNRMLQSLRGDALISTGRRTITIEDLNALQVAGDFNHAYLHPEAGDGQPL